MEVEGSAGAERKLSKGGEGGGRESWGSSWQGGGAAREEERESGRSRKLGAGGWE